MTREEKLAYYKAYQKVWYAKNKERRLLKILEWREANLESYKAKQAKYRKTRRAKDLRNAAHKRYSQKDSTKELLAGKASRRRALEHNRPASRVFYRDVLKRHGYICGICGKSIKGKYEIDHVIALSLGGSHTLENMQPAHPLCNRKKGGIETHERKRWLF